MTIKAEHPGIPPEFEYLSFMSNFSIPSLTYSYFLEVFSQKQHG